MKKFIFFIIILILVFSVSVFADDPGNYNYLFSGKMITVHLSEDLSGFDKIEGNFVEAFDSFILLKTEHGTKFSIRYEYIISITID